jgi:hypothetical protein
MASRKYAIFASNTRFWDSRREAIARNSVSMAYSRVMWIAAEHSDQDNLQWSLLRGIEWSGWPLFMSQPIVPVLLYFYDWYWVLIGVFLVTLLWRVTVLQWFVSVRLVSIGPLFVLLKFLTCPLMAFLIWRQGHHLVALLALLWPFAGMILSGSLLTIIHGFLGLFIPVLSPERTIHVGPIQNRFMNALGYARTEESKGPRARMDKAKIDTVREVTGLELDRAEILYEAFVTGDWSQVSTDELQTRPVPRETLWFEKGAKATLKRQLMAAVIIERSRRESVATREKFFKPDYD